MGIPLYYHTIRYLRPCQIYGRAFLLLPPGRPSLAPPPPKRLVRGTWVGSARRKPSMSGPGRSCFLNEDRSIAGMGTWNDPGAKKLWLYNLHYFDDLNAKESDQRQEWHVPLIRRWIDENPPASGVGWDPYPTSLRIVNWIKWTLGGGPIPEDAVRSLSVQARHLERCLEYHLLGNHLFANAKALVFAGMFFEGPECERWLRKGLDLLEREVPEQVLADGGHFERSPMYHSLVLEDLLDLVNLGRAYEEGSRDFTRGMAARWSETAVRMLKWLSVMRHPDGEISLFNDAAFGIASSPGELAAYAERLGLDTAEGPRDGVTHLAESGYVRLQGGEAVLFFDVGPPGPDYLPAHGHADTLSFELSLCSKRMIVDTGTSTYDTCPDRLYQRGTSAHNTVVVDGKDSSEVWGSFRMARRAKPFGLRIDEKGGGVSVECSHDGYRRLPGKVVHKRRWVFGPGRLRIEDSLDGRFRVAEAGFLLHPAVVEVSSGMADTDSPTDSGTWRVTGGKTVRWRVEGGEGRFSAVGYHPEFGVSRKSSRLVVPFSGQQTAFELTWD